MPKHRTNEGQPLGTLPTEHGQRTTYIKGCRCGPCSQANTDYIKKYRRAQAEDARKWREHNERQVQAS